MKQDHHITRPTILVVDDHPEQLSALFTELQLNGYSLLIAQNGAEAFRILGKIQPDMIVLDVRLPDMDGFEICRQLKQSGNGCEIPVLFTTGITELEGKLQGFQAGCADYITKPFQLDEVLARIRTHLTIRKLQQALHVEKERFKGLSEVTFEGILLHDQGRIMEVNKRLERMFGFTREALLLLDVHELLCPEFRKMTEDMMAGETEGAHEVQGRRKDGTLIPLEIQSRAVHYQERELRVLALRDISWRKNLEQEALQLSTENVVLKASLSDRDHLGELIGRGAAMQKAYERLLKAAVSDAPVILSGETGVGKELAARTIWQLSEKYTRTFISVNCAAIQEPLFESQFFGYRKGAFTGATQDEPGYFDQSMGGVLFLDEISELTLTLQAKLLRVLNNGEYTPVGDTRPRIADVRIIAATNRSLRDMVASGRFREDLFHRLHVISIHMPPLRQHKEDLPLLIDHFFRPLIPDGDTRIALPDEILERFREYEWPGNVRELANEVRRYVAMDEVELQSPYTSGHPDEGSSLAEKMGAHERKIIEDTLNSAGGNRVRASELLRVPLATLYRKIQKYGL